MKFYPNLAKGLRTLFGVLRILVLIAVVAWTLIFAFGGKLYGSTGKKGFILSVGTVSIDASPNPFAPVNSGDVGVSHLRGTLELDWLNADPEALKAMRWALIPMVLVSSLFAWMFLGYLRRVCSNLERGEIFTGANFQSVRALAITMIAYGGIGLLVQLWAQQLINGYLIAHAKIATATAGSGTFCLHYAGETYIDLLTVILAGLLVLLMSEAFRQGVQLKAENDLTV